MKKQSMQVLAFKFGDDLFALELHKVLSVENIVQVTALPGSPPAILGFVVIAGEIYHVLNFSRIFYNQSSTIHLAQKMIIIDDDGLKYVIVADEIFGLTELSIQLNFDEQPKEKDILIQIKSLPHFQSKWGVVFLLDKSFFSKII